MKKILWIIPLIAMFLVAGRLDTGLQNLNQADGTLFTSDSLAGTDTVYTETYTLMEGVGHTGFITLSFDVTSQTSDSTSLEVFLLEGTIDGTWMLTTEVCSLNYAADWDTAVDLNLQPTKVWRIGITALAANDDTLIFENLRTFTMPE